MVSQAPPQFYDHDKVTEIIADLKVDKKVEKVSSVLETTGRAVPFKRNFDHKTQPNSFGLIKSLARMNLQDEGDDESETSR